MVSASPPLETGRLISLYGWRNRPTGPDLHTGIDLGTAEGTRVLSVLKGKVIVSLPTGRAENYGNLVVIEHGPDDYGGIFKTERLYSLYAHLKDVFVKGGDRVKAGDAIGTAGRTCGTHADPGKLFATDRAHLHFEILTSLKGLKRGYADRYRVNPSTFFAPLGIIVPPKGELLTAAGSPAEHGLKRAESAPGFSRAIPRGIAAGAAGLAALLILWAISEHKESRRG